MKCPIDGADLVMSERQGVEIDYCPSCRGVWLDRGELDKILDRAASLASPAAAPPVGGVSQPTAQSPVGYPVDPYPATPYGGGHRDERRDDRYDERRDPRGYDPRREQPYRKKKKESWLGDILDFG